MSTSLTDYTTALDSTGVSDLPTATKTDFVNLARQEVIDAYPWPFKESVNIGTHGITITSPATDPLDTYIPGTEYIKVKTAVNEFGDVLTPLTESGLTDMGVSFETAIDAVGTPVYYTVFYIIGTDGSRDTYVIPYPYGQITVVPLVPSIPLDATLYPTDYQIPAAYKMLVVYGAAVHAYSLIGVSDLADNYRNRYTELMQSLINNQMQHSFDVPDMDYQAGA